MDERAACPVPAPKQEGIKIGDIVLRYGTIAMVILLLIVFWLIQPRFLSFANVINILRAGAIQIVLATGLSILLASGGFDLSVGATASTASVVCAAMMVWFDSPMWLAIVCAILVGVLIGLLNGFLTIRLGIADFLATLGVAFLIDGIHLTIGQGNAIHNFMTNPWTKQRAPGEIGAAFRWLATGDVGPIPVLVIIAAVIAIAAHILLNNTRWGRYFYIIGGNRDAAYLSGVDVSRTKLFAHILCSGIAAIGGVLLTARIGSGQIYAGSPYQLMGLLSVYVGYTVLAAGKAFIPGTVVGALFATIMLNGLTMSGVHPYSVDIFRGAALIFAVAVQSYQSMRAKTAR